MATNKPRYYRQPILLEGRQQISPAGQKIIEWAGNSQSRGGDTKKSLARKLRAGGMDRRAFWWAWHSLTSRGIIYINRFGRVAIKPRAGLITAKMVAGSGADPQLLADTALLVDQKDCLDAFNCPADDAGFIKTDAPTYANKINRSPDTARKRLDRLAAASPNPLKVDKQPGPPNQYRIELGDQLAKAITSIRSRLPAGKTKLWQKDKGQQEADAREAALLKKEKAIRDGAGDRQGLPVSVGQAFDSRWVVSADGKSVSRAPD